MARIETARYAPRGGLALAPVTGPPPAWREAPVPPVLALPLEQQAGAEAIPCVAVGDRVQRGQCIARPPGAWDAAIHASSSGEVVAIAPCPVALHTVAPRPCILIRTDGADSAVAPLPPCDPARESRAAVLRRLAEAGVVGLGGAVFSTAAKLARADAPITTLIVNAAECEPHIRCDEALLAHAPAHIAAGIQALAVFLGQPEVLIGLKETLDPRPLAAALDAAGSSAARIIRVPARYTAGAEDVLIRLLTGREVPRGALPLDIGCVCLNVATVVAAGRALLAGEPLTTRVVSVSGRDLSGSANLITRLGTPVSALLAACGGAVAPGQRVILGGPMMGVELANTEIPITKASQAVWMPGAGDLPAPGPERACIRCGACVTACPVNLLPQQLHWHARAADPEALTAHGLEVCIECGCCDVVCPSQIPLVARFRAAKAALAEVQVLDLRARWLKDRFVAHGARLDARTARAAEETALRREDPRARLARLRAHRARKDADEGSA